mgnify:CR=1 FL=1
MISQAVFLVGGLGTRLGQYTATTPKPLLKVGGRPFLDYLLDQAAGHGFTDIRLLAGHHGEKVMDGYDGADWRGARVQVSCEPEPLGTGGALRFVQDQLDDIFLLANGDSYLDIDLRAFIESGRTPGPRLALIGNVAGDRYGRVTLDGDAVRVFSAPGVLGHGPINGGVYRMLRSDIAQLPVGFLSLESGLLPQLAAEGRLTGVVYDAYFIDIGVPEDFERADREFPERF